ncbi:MAG: hypothetical protein AVDCRST_MAG56-563 [uncultured Cytophagales bacterium]|uniref:Uncharacterized protein n=1 Tax=uncultured Cytophagales bacterium TaxID=158755 RepID=A0A6J4HGT5_9SPHI|nr:MAG: hypothetical protein AVDCRST_MAG56-563 [uncultured Cytophagales bacterium]
MPARPGKSRFFVNLRQKNNPGRRNGRSYSGFKRIGCRPFTPVTSFGNRI